MTTALEKFIEESDWIFAKTMPEAPHYYIVRSKENEENFIALAQYIREHGYEAYYGDFTSPFTYLEYCGFRYWTMGNPLPETTILNRCDMILYEKTETPEGIYISLRKKRKCSKANFKVAKTELFLEVLQYEEQFFQRTF